MYFKIENLFANLILNYSVLSGMNMENFGHIYVKQILITLVVQITNHLGVKTLISH